MVAQVVVSGTEAGRRVKGADATHRIVALLDAPVVNTSPRSP